MGSLELMSSPSYSMPHGRGSGFPSPPCCHHPYHKQTPISNLERTQELGKQGIYAKARINCTLGRLEREETGM